MDKDFYNQCSSEKLGWQPEWFGASGFDEMLVDAVKKWQRKLGIKSDGLVGPQTFRRVWTERESKISTFEPRPSLADTNHLVHNGNFYEIKWDKVVLWDEPDGFSCSEGTYSSYAGRSDRDPHFFVTHWDAALSSSSCAKIMKKRGLSVHFCIDNDGTIFQTLDTQHAAWQAGSRSWNHDSIGVEISNAYYPKYQEWYVKQGLGERPVMSGVKCHGSKMKDFLGFYDVQIDALAALYEAINRKLGIPLESPTDSMGRHVETISPAAASGRFAGFVSHYHLTKRKIDCAGLDLVDVCRRAKNV
jgi:hypothetical protein